MGLLKLKKAQKGTYFNCLKNKCPQNCCTIFDMVQLETDEIENHLENVKINDTHYLKQKKCPMLNKLVCIEFTNGLCSKYQKRPKSCAEYPWYKFNNVIYIDTGCPGVKMNQNVGNMPQKHEILDSYRYFYKLPYLLRKIVFLLLTKT